jgi:hypothetical protein
MLPLFLSETIEKDFWNGPMLTQKSQIYVFPNKVVMFFRKKDMTDRHILLD